MSGSTTAPTSANSITSGRTSTRNTSETFVNGDQAFPLAVTTEYWRIINQVATGDIDPAAAAGDLQTFIDNNQKK